MPHFECKLGDSVHLFNSIFSVLTTPNETLDFPSLYILFKAFPFILIAFITPANYRSNLCSMKIFLEVWQRHSPFMFPKLKSLKSDSRSPFHMNLEIILSHCLTLFAGIAMGRA